MASEATASTASSSSQTGSLARGQACITCRRKKMRCDGARPFCGPCSLTRNPSHCEYTDKQGRTFTEILEERLRLLKMRIKDLEERQKDAPVFLRHPYPHEVAYSVSGPDRRGSPARPSDIPGTESSAIPSLSEVPSAPGIDREFGFPDLLQVFLPHAHRLHFVLDVSTFSRDVSRPLDDPLHPHESLISAISLWALCIMSPYAEYAIHESQTLKHAIDSIPASLTSPHSHHRTQAIQAEVLLALYFFSDSRLMEGWYHLSAAIAGVLANGLHRIVNSDTSSASPVLLPVGALQQHLDTPRNATELNERINLFWTVYALDRCWSVAMGLAPAILDRSSSILSIHTPAPAALDFSRVITVEEISRSRVLEISSFLDGTADYSILADSDSSLVSYVIAAALFERATRIAASHNTELSSDLRTDQEVERLFQAIVRFNDALRALDSPSTSREAATSSVGTICKQPKLRSPIADPHNDTCGKLLAQSLGFAAIIQLYFPLMNTADADERCHAAVRDIARLIRSDARVRSEKADFFLGIIWLSAVRVLVNELAALSPSPTSPVDAQTNTNVSVGSKDTEDSFRARERQFVTVSRAQEIADNSEVILAAIRALSETCPLIASQLELLEGSKEGSCSE